jgi:NADPH:quinone reductase-like Zn-dependent oxidoreductase
MKAAIITRYGPPEVLEVQDAPVPSPGPGQVRVHVRASTVCAGDVRLRRASPFFLRAVSGGVLRPTRVRTPGMELSGTIDALGDGVTRFRIGEAVFGSAGLNFGACAEFACASEAMLAPRPAMVSDAEAATLPFGGISALYYLRAAGLAADQRLLVYGASGSVGTAAVQLGKHLGAHVTAVCGAANAELVRGLGADVVRDYEKQDYAEPRGAYDVLFDTVGKSGIRLGLRALKRGGVYAFSASPLTAFVLVSLWAALTGRVRVVGGMARGGGDDLAYLMSLVEQGKFQPVIDRAYPLDNIVEAHRYVEGGHKRGNVVIAIG